VTSGMKRRPIEQLPVIRVSSIARSGRSDPGNEPDAPTSIRRVPMRGARFAGTV
jgi:hypothetical protein